MSVHLFKRAGAGQYCLSLDPTGTNIPAPMNGDTWIYIKALTLTPGENYAALEAKVAMSELARDGYVLIGGWYDRH